jgi:hypothetical protein
MSGTNQGGRASAAMSIFEESPAACSRAQQILGVQDADDVLGRLAPQRHARHRCGEHRLDHGRGRIVGIDGDHLGAVDHHVRDGKVAQVEQAAEHVAVELLDVAFLMQEIDRAAQLLVRREHRPAFVDLPARRGRRMAAHQRLDRDQGPGRAGGPTTRSAWPPPAQRGRGR